MSRPLATIGQRFTSQFVDGLVAIGAGVIFYLIANAFALPLELVFVGYLVYLLLCDGLPGGQSLGKRFTTSGKRPPPALAKARRAAVLAVPFFWRTLLLASLLAGLFAGAVSAQTLPAGMTMHRLQAGEPDATGWMLAAATEGGFSVRLPLKFNDFTLAESNPKAAALRTYTVGARSQEGIKFTATRIVYRKGAESAKYFFSRFEKGLDLGSRPQRVTPLDFRGRRAVDIVLARASDVSYQRVVLLDADLLLMVLESPRNHEATAQEFTRAFFDSLVVHAR